MGREIRRVPLDFSWPIREIWGGFKNPFSSQAIECPDCEGSGSSPESRLLTDKWYGRVPFNPEERGSKPFLPSDPAVRRFAERNVSNAPGFYGTGEPAIEQEARRLCGLFNRSWCHHLNEGDVAALIKAGRLHDFTHTWADGWKKKNPPYLPTPKEVNEWSISGMGHDSINQWTCVSAECKRLGYETTCKRCDGEGSLWPTKKIKEQHETWKPVNPPKGKAYQLWETVSEGSPVSPPFATAEELARWLAESPEYTNKVDEGTTYEEWLKFILGPGWAPSFISNGSVLMSGVQAVSTRLIAKTP